MRITCPGCNGAGTVRRFTGDGFKAETRVCERCAGEGWTLMAEPAEQMRMKLGLPANGLNINASEIRGRSPRGS